MTEPVTIGIGATKWVKDANTKMITLTKPLTTAAELSLHGSDGADYQVPVGKKFIILKIFIGGGHYSYVGNGSSDLELKGEIHVNTTTDSLTGATLVFQNSGGTTRHFYGTYHGSSFSQPASINAETYIEVAAGSYIVGKGAGTNISIGLTGVETNV